MGWYWVGLEAFLGLYIPAVCSRRESWNCPLLVCRYAFNSLGLRTVVGIGFLWLNLGNQNVTETGKGLGRWKKGKGRNHNPQLRLHAIQPMPIVFSCLFPCTCFWSTAHVTVVTTKTKGTFASYQRRWSHSGNWKGKLLFLRIFIEGYPHCHLCFREVLPLIADSVYFSHVWCSRLGSALWATVLLSQSFLWTLQPCAINLCVVLGWPTQRVRYFLEAVFHFPMASYCENAMVGSLCQHCCSLPALLQAGQDYPSQSSTLCSALSLIWDLSLLSHFMWTASCKVRCLVTTAHLPKAFVSAFGFNCSRVFWFGGFWFCFCFFLFSLIVRETEICSMCFTSDGAF